MAKAEDVILGIENEPIIIGANAQKVAELLTLINHPCVRSVWDQGNECSAVHASTSLW